MAFAKTERRRGKALCDHQLVQLKVNEMHAMTESLRSFVMRVGWEMDHHVQSANPCS
jgi:alkylation response protein AidB-like acyl-CoA dehydrogenase